MRKLLMSKFLLDLEQEARKYGINESILPEDHLETLTRKYNLVNELQELSLFAENTCREVGMKKVPSSSAQLFNYFVNELGVLHVDGKLYLIEDKHKFDSIFVDALMVSRPGEPCDLEFLVESLRTYGRDLEIPDYIVNILIQMLEKLRSIENETEKDPL